MTELPLKTGRPSKSHRHPDEVKTEILMAAVGEFAQHGLAATSTEAIAQRSGVTKAMIHYYFKTKEGLYRAVLQDLFKNLSQLTQQSQWLEIAPEIALKGLIQQILEHTAYKPQIHAILTLEAIQNQGRYYRDIAASKLIYQTLSDILDRGVQSGVFRQLHPQHTAINIMGSCLFYFIAQGNLQHFFPELSMDEPQTIQQHIQTAIAFIMSGVLHENVPRSLP